MCQGKNARKNIVHHGNSIGLRQSVTCSSCGGGGGSGNACLSHWEGSAWLDGTREGGGRDIKWLKGSPAAQLQRFPKGRVLTYFWDNAAPAEDHNRSGFMKCSWSQNREERFEFGIQVPWRR